MQFSRPVIINTRAYKPQYFRSRSAMMLDKFWVGVLVVHFCLIVAAGNVITITGLLLTFVINISGYTFYKGRK